MKSGAIFDMDGTLLDTEQMYRTAWLELASEYGQTPNPDMPRAVAGTNGAQMIAIIERFYPEIDAEQFMQDCIDRVKERVTKAVPKKYGMDELLEFLHKNGVKMAIASSNSVGQIEKNMKLAGVLHYFSAIAGGPEVSNSKPAPDIIQLAASRLGLDPRDCYVFEDGINGVHAGVAAGCTTVMIPDGNQPNEEMYRICAGVYDTLCDVKHALEQGEI